MIRDSYKAHKLETTLQSKRSALSVGSSDEAALVRVAQLLQEMPQKAAPAPTRRRRYLAAAALEVPAARGVQLVNWATGLSGAMLAIGLILTTVLAAHSKPGSSLYAYKHQGQSLRLKLETNANDRANLQLRYAVSRLEETEHVLSDLSANAEQKTAAITELANQTEATVETVRQVAIANNNQDLLNKLEDLTSKQTEVLATANDPAVKDAAKTALKTTEAGTKTIAEAKQLVAAANESTVTELPTTITGAISKLSEAQLEIGQDIILLTDKTEIIGLKDNAPKPLLKVGQQVSILTTTVEGKLTANVITITPDVPKKPVEKPKPTTPEKEVEEEIPEEAEKEPVPVQSGFVIESPTPQYPAD